MSTAVTFLAARRFADERGAQRDESLAGVSVIAGAVWPVLVVGVVELGSLVTVLNCTTSSAYWLCCTLVLGLGTTTFPGPYSALDRHPGMPLHPDRVC